MASVRRKLNAMPTVFEVREHVVAGGWRVRKCVCLCVCMGGEGEGKEACVSMCVCVCVCLFVGGGTG